MAKPERYVPRLNDPVMVEGMRATFVVVGVDASQQMARVVTTTTTPAIVQTVPWSKLSYLDESPNATRIVRDATQK